MSTFNPYSAPRTPADALLLPESAWDAWRDLDQLVVAHDAYLPDQCIKCNAPTDGRRNVFNFTWHPPMIFVGVLFGGIVYIVLAMILQKKMTVEVSLCDVHRRKRRHALLIGWSGAIAGVLMMLISISKPGNTTIWLLLAGLALMFFSIIYGFLAARVVWPKRIDSHYAWLKGACPEYLSGLPDFSGEED